ncbi:protein FAR1-RELATED SEQUENCE 6-like [Macadamia integrifolia]|uniref:protein FAR1-RELATED SEQUENCE 6-like n=1 Tax=Macadamia integrifolia TaxID=60698 RepID=UPI001C4FE00E|nr:protein FAR1-RELATED SEQUENCE 6-like [Macadamia integrifolia]
MEARPPDGDPPIGGESNEHVTESDCARIEVDDGAQKEKSIMPVPPVVGMGFDFARAEIHDGAQKEKIIVPPFVGMEFESYDDAYDYYNCYAMELGFGVRVRNSYCGKTTKEKIGAVLCCSCEGYKEKIGSIRLKPETRTGCLAMIRLKLISKNWQITEVKLEHNHVNIPESVRLFKFHKNISSGIKRKLQSVDAGGYANLNSDDKDASDFVGNRKRLKFQEGDAQALYNYFCHMQLTSSNFFYVMDVSDNGHLRNVFWADARFRAAYGYFGDVVAFETTYLKNKYEMSFAPFVGVNHHGNTILLGCGLLADETTESFVWLFKAWLSCMSGSAPSAIITDQCKAIQEAIAVVFPNTHHRLCLWHIMQKFPDQLGALQEYESIKKAMGIAVYDSLTVSEFEAAWENLIQSYGIGHNEWIRTLYEHRKIWVPVFLRGTFFAGMSTTQRSEKIYSFFDGYVHQTTSLKEFLDKYELTLHKKYEIESKFDFESRHRKLVLKTKCSYERQLSELYTNSIFKKFQHEIEDMVLCFNTSQVNVDGPTIKYIVKEHYAGGANGRMIRDYEVLYNSDEIEVSCICNWFDFKGYLCRHALSVLNYNDVREVPSKYILPRWRKDFKRIYVAHKSQVVDVKNSVKWYDQLYSRAIQTVEEGVISEENYTLVLQGLEEVLAKIHGTEKNASNNTPTPAQPTITKVNSFQC